MKRLFFLILSVLHVVSGVCVNGIEGERVSEALPLHVFFLHSTPTRRGRRRGGGGGGALTRGRSESVVTEGEQILPIVSL